MTRHLYILALALLLPGCVGAVVGVAVDTTTEVIKAPFTLAGAVVGVAADTTGTVIGAPFRMVGAAVDHDEHDHQGDRRHDRDGHYHDSDRDHDAEHHGGDHRQQESGH